MSSSVPPRRKAAAARPWRERTTAELQGGILRSRDFRVLYDRHMAAPSGATRADLLTWIRQYVARFINLGRFHVAADSDELLGVLTEFFVVNFERVIRSFDPARASGDPYLFQICRRQVWTFQWERRQEEKYRDRYAAMVEREVTYPSPYHAFEARDAVRGLRRRMVRAVWNFRFPEYGRLYLLIVRRWFRTGDEPACPADARQVPHVIWHAALVYFRQQLAAHGEMNFEVLYRMRRGESSFAGPS